MTASIVKLAATALAALPIKYLATLFGAGDQDVLRWFILVVAVLLDPAAVLSYWPRQGGDRGLLHYRMAAAALLAQSLIQEAAPLQDGDRLTGTEDRGAITAHDGR